MLSRGDSWFRPLRSLLVAAATGLLVTACDDGPTSGPQNVLVGQWGSSTAELIAIHAGAELTDGCAAVVITRPIVLRDDGSFQTSGRLRVGLTTGGPMTAVEGDVQGSSLTVRAILYDADGPATFVLESGVRPDPDLRPERPL